MTKQQEKIDVECSQKQREVEGMEFIGKGGFKQKDLKS